jgi:hypothetical protein
VDLKARCDAIEECYELMLAYAAQGVVAESGSESAGQLRALMQRGERALVELGPACRAAAAEIGAEPADRYLAFIEVLDRDARSALAAMQLVIAQPSISSQLIENLNASIHLRALLTDLFLLDEILGEHARATHSS